MLWTVAVKKSVLLCYSCMFCCVLLFPMFFVCAVHEWSEWICLRCLLVRFGFKLFIISLFDSYLNYHICHDVCLNWVHLEFTAQLSELRLVIWENNNLSCLAFDVSPWSLQNSFFGKNLVWSVFSHNLFRVCTTDCDVDSFDRSASSTHSTRAIFK